MVSYSFLWRVRKGEGALWKTSRFPGFCKWKKRLLSEHLADFLPGFPLCGWKFFFKWILLWIYLDIVKPESETVETALTWRYALFSSLEGGCPWRVSRLRLKRMYWDWEYKSSLSICGKQRNEFSPGLILDPGVQNVCHFRLQTFLKYPCVLSLFRLFVTAWIVACQAPLSMGFSRQEHWNRVAMPSSRGSDQTRVSYDSCIGKCSLPLVPPGKPLRIPRKTLFPFIDLCWGDWHLFLIYHLFVAKQLLCKLQSLRVSDGKSDHQCIKLSTTGSEV